MEEIKISQQENDLDFASNSESNQNVTFNQEKSSHASEVCLIPSELLGPIDENIEKITIVDLTKIEPSKVSTPNSVSIFEEQLKPLNQELIDDPGKISEDTSTINVDQSKKIDLTLHPQVSGNTQEFEIEEKEVSNTTKPSIEIDLKPITPTVSGSSWWSKTNTTANSSKQTSQVKNEATSIKPWWQKIPSITSVQPLPKNTSNTSQTLQNGQSPNLPDLISSQDALKSAQSKKNSILTIEEIAPYNSTVVLFESTSLNLGSIQEKFKQLELPDNLKVILEQYFTEIQTEIKYLNQKMDKKLKEFEYLENRNRELTLESKSINSTAASANDSDLKKINEKIELEVGLLQEKINVLVSDKVNYEKRLKAEAVDRIKKDKFELEEKFKKEKYELEEKCKKDNVALGSANEKLKLELEATKTQNLKKYEKDIATKNEEVAKQSLKIKQLEQEIITIKIEIKKITEDNHIKLVEAKKEIESKEKENHQMKLDVPMLRAKILDFENQTNQLQSSLEIAVSEMEVSKSAHERVSKLLLEKEEGYKKTKQKNDELFHSEALAKKTIAKIEKERDEYLVLSNQLKATTSELESNILANGKRLEAEKDISVSRISELQLSVEQKTTEIELLNQKIQDMEREFKISEKKNLQIIKDLQKQFNKERKQREYTIEEDSAIKPSSSLAFDSSDTHSRGEDDHQLQDRLHKLSEELEFKSKIIQQYILRENESFLQPEMKSVTKGPTTFNLNIFSSSAAIQKMDPVLLSQVIFESQK